MAAGTSPSSQAGAVGDIGACDEAGATITTRSLARQTKQLVSFAAKAASAWAGVVTAGEKGRLTFSTFPVGAVKVITVPGAASLSRSSRFWSSGSVAAAMPVRALTLSSRGSVLDGAVSSESDAVGTVGTISSALPSDPQISARTSASVTWVPAFTGQVAMVFWSSSSNWLIAGLAGTSITSTADASP